MYTLKVLLKVLLLAKLLLHYLLLSRYLNILLNLSRIIPNVSLLALIGRDDELSRIRKPGVLPIR